MLYYSSQLSRQNRRVVVTGGGIITALGLGWESNAEGFRLGRNAFRPVTLFDVSRQRTKIAAEVDLPQRLPRPFAKQSRVRRLDRSGRMLFHAAHEALQNAGWERASFPFILGTTSGGMSLGEDYYRTAIQNPLAGRQQPTRALAYQAQFQNRLVAEALDSCGQVITISNACASGANAVGHAWELIRSGQSDRVLAGGYDALSQFVFAGFDSLQALSPSLCRPFDANRDGLGLGEGAAVFALEELSVAVARNANILGEIVGYGAATDRHHLTQPHPDGDAAVTSMTEACAVAGLMARDIDYVNAHGTGTTMNDSAEASAIGRWAGEYASMLPVSSTKSSIGHLLGAAGAVEVAVCLMALRGQWLPPTSTLLNPDPICAFPLVRVPSNAKLKHVLTNSFGFGGANASLVLRLWE